MGFYDPRNKEISPRAARLYAAFSVAHSIADFAAAALFVIGSVLFFNEALKTPGIWCFLVGSVCFLLKPTIRLIREIKLAALDEVSSLASRAPEGPGNVHFESSDDK
ncbi:YrhK family protein [Paramicrobacterium agarici]|uniref:YrhK family protein n=1 Tax=Paramicrobacterium agarici TaxID=630514 RepID=UPI00114E0756|nr:YrhK family protein [Microbacterium agarici]TQO23640.1 YrhK-like protein [Microbacterium agarici]